MTLVFDWLVLVLVVALLLSAAVTQYQNSEGSNIFERLTDAVWNGAVEIGLQLLGIMVVVFLVGRLVNNAI